MTTKMKDVCCSFLAQLAELFMKVGHSALCVWMSTRVEQIITAAHRDL